ncbi:MAG TPA: winged helix-turn-helix domain-containing protein [Ktedonobacterales bacterium]
MDTRTDGRGAPPRAVDLRRGRAPEIEILASDTYDFLISLHVALASPDYHFTDYDVGRGWIEAARAAGQAADPRILGVLGHYLGDGRATSLHATLISLVWRCPEPRDVPHFLEWLRALPTDEIVEVLLDQDGLGADWSAVLAATLAAPRSEEQRIHLLTRYVEELRPTVAGVIANPEGTRDELLKALDVWQAAVFAEWASRVHPMLRREAALLERRRSEVPTDRFVEETMRGVQWQRPSGLRRIVFAPSYFCRPAVFYHFWRDTLTFVLPVEEDAIESATDMVDPEAPSPEVLRFFEALGDPTRLRILRLLAEREMYLTELSERLKLTKATTKHHMVRLRAAGLVTLYDRERLTYYALRVDVARHARQLLDRHLGPRG